MFKSQSNIGEDYKETFTYGVILTEIQSYYFKTKFIHTYIEEAVDNGVCVYLLHSGYLSYPHTNFVPQQLS